MNTPRPLRHLLPDTRGNVAMIFALALIPLLLVAGFAIDAQLAFSKKGKIQHAVDSAVLAGARMMQNVSDEEEVREHARTYFNAIMTSDQDNLTCDPLDVTFTGPEEIQGNVRCYQPTTLMRLGGHDQVEIVTEGSATYGTGRLDVAFIFDVSGSMNSYGRIWDLKTAAKDAADVLLPEPGSPSDGDVRIAMVGYNSMVNAGEYFEEVTGLKKERTYQAEVTSTDWQEQEVEREGWYQECEWVCNRYAGRSGRCRDWDRECEWEYGTYTDTQWVEVETTTTEERTIDSTCVFERDGDYAFTNDQPLQLTEDELLEELEEGQLNASETSDNEEGFLTASHAVWEDHHYGGSWDTVGDDCLNIEPFGLSHDGDDIEDYIDDLYANGGTAGHQGIAWGWYMISDRWSDVFTGDARPLDKTEPDVVKAMIVMTDGAFNRQFHDDQGDSTEQAEDLCDTIKDDDVIIYTIAFQAPDEGEEVLEYCASGPEFYFSADNGQELVESYRAIATSISDLRISH